LLAALAAVAGVTTSAFASTPATTDQAAAVAAVDGNDPQCVTVRISSADESYAELYDAGNPDCTQVGDGAVVYHLAGGAWKVAWEGSGPPSCPHELPQAVAIDFKICTGPSKRVYVARDGKLVYKPRALIQGAHGEYINLRWTGWGTAKAVAHGLFFYEDRNETFKLKVRVTLTTRRLCGEKRTYKHMTVRLLQGSASDQKTFGGRFDQLGCGYDLDDLE
jgi:hypothetical protein